MFVSWFLLWNELYKSCAQQKEVVRFQFTTLYVNEIDVQNITFRNIEMIPWERFVAAIS